jgi:hypothetical protein
MCWCAAGAALPGLLLNLSAQRVLLYQLLCWQLGLKLLLVPALPVAQVAAAWPEVQAGLAQVLLLLAHQGTACLWQMSIQRLRPLRYWCCY